MLGSKLPLSYFPASDLSSQPKRLEKKREADIV